MRRSFVDDHGLRTVEHHPFDVLHDADHAGLAEIVVRPGSAAVGRRLEDLRLRKEYGVVVLGIHRGDRLDTGELRPHRLAGGDVLVVFTPWDRLRRIDADASFVVLTEHPPEPARTSKRWWAIGALVTALTLVMVAGTALSLALMTGVAILLVGRVMSPDEAYRAVSWKTVFLLAGLIPLGQAVETTGTAAWIASGVIDTVGDLPPWTVQLTIALLATVFTLVVSNLGATVLLVPLAANVAVGVGADPAQFGLIVAIAASNAFLLPTHQVNALLMTPGGYGVRDYLRAGTAMSVVFIAVLVVTVNLFA